MLEGISPYITDEVLVLQTKFNVDKYSIKGEFMILFGLRSVEEFRKAIKNTYGAA